MKTIFLSLIFTLMLANYQDLITKHYNDMIYIDGINETFLREKAPYVYSWRKHKFEIRKLCKTVECNYDQLFNKVKSESNNNFIISKCILENSYDCNLNNQEKEATNKIEELVSKSNYINSINLNNETFILMSNSKTEEGMVLMTNEERKKIECKSNKK